MSKNPFIVVEALDAGGSQTQADRLVANMKKAKFDVLSLHFPQEDQSTGRMVYDKFLLNKNKEPFSRREQSLLYIQDFYSRNEDIAQHLSNNKKSAVISDRYCTSTFAYQTIGLTGAKRQAMLDWLIWLCYKDKPQLHKPDLVIFIDTPVDISLERLASKKKDFFETKIKLTAIRNSYLRVAKQQKWVTVNGVDDQGRERTRKDLENEIWQIVTRKFI